MRLAGPCDDHLFGSTFVTLSLAQFSRLSLAISSADVPTSRPYVFTAFISAEVLTRVGKALSTPRKKHAIT